MMDAINRLQKLDPNKFTELCHMHLTFTLDLHDDELSALLNVKSVQKCRKGYFSRKLKEKSVGDVLPLSQENISQIYQVIEYLGRDGNVEHEGLFRKTGSLSRQQELKTLLSAGANIDFSLGHYSIDDCASVLKNFLAELPEPLLTEVHYSAYCQIADMKQPNTSPNKKDHIFQQQLKSVRLLLLLLPADNYCLLKYLLLLLSQVKAAHTKNKMTAENLATVFAPQILCPKKMSAVEFKDNSSRMVKAVSFLIENATLLFEPPIELVRDVRLCLADLDKKKSFQSSYTETEPVKTSIAFCERANINGQDTMDYTNKALSELQQYIQNLPNSARKRKLIKKFQNETSNENINECGRKHFRSRSVGEVLKKHLFKNATAKDKSKFQKNYYHTSYDMLSTRTSSSSLEQVSSSKAKSVDALNLEKSPNINRLGPLGKNWLRASKKIKSWHS